MIEKGTAQDSSVTRGKLEEVAKLASNTLVFLDEVKVNGSGAIVLANSVGWLLSMKESCEIQLKRLEEGLKETSEKPRKRGGKPIEVA